jgi:O-antigen ligase
MNSDRVSKSVLLLIAILALINVFFYIIPSIAFVLIILIGHFVCLNRFESAFLLSFFAGTFGMYFASMEIIGIGTILFSISITIFVLDYQNIISTYLNRILPLLLIALLFTVSVVTTSGGDFAEQKLLKTFATAFISSFAFAHLFSYFHKYRTYLMSLMIAIYALFILRYAMDYYHFSNLEDIFEMGFLRNIVTDKNANNSDLQINYQTIGFMGVFSLSLLLVTSKASFSKFYFYTTYLFTVFVVYFSGSRQAILTLIIIIALDIARKNKGRKYLRRILFFSGFIFMSFYVLLQMDVWFLKDLFQADTLLEGSGRSELIETGLDQYSKNKMAGVGYGRYINPDLVYGGSPHNIFVELLSETGLIGLFTIISILAISFYRNYKFFKTNNKYLFGFYCILITLFVRSMVSSSIATNIELFAILIVLPLYRPIIQKVRTSNFTLNATKNNNSNN